MSHMVIYRGADGKPGYHQTDDIHDAVGFVEQMRNEDGVEHARIFRLEEVVFEYRPYFRVELHAAGGAPTMIGGPQPAQLPQSQTQQSGLGAPLDAVLPQQREAQAVAEQSGAALGIAAGEGDGLDLWPGGEGGAHDSVPAAG